MRGAKGADRVVLAALVAVLVAVGLPASASASVISEFALPNAASSPDGITTGPDGALWFTEFEGFRIGRITTGGSIMEREVPSQPEEITQGPDGNIWFTRPFGTEGVVKMTPGFGETPYSFPNTQPRGITEGPDGNLWFIEEAANKVVRITTGGAPTEYTVPTATAYPEGITAGPDGALWFTEGGANKIGRVTTSGSFSEHSVLTANSFPDYITQGSDGALWFTESGANKIGRITTSGTVSEFQIPSSNSFLGQITGGPDGAIWFTEPSANKIGRITTDGTITEYPLPTASAGPEGITAGPDGALWFTESQANKIGRITIPDPGNRGPAGPPGAEGKAGPPGAAGAPGKIQLVTCTTVTVKVRKGHKVRKVKRRRCTTKLVSGSVRFTTAAEASLTHAGTLYATGTASRAGIVLRALEPVHAGRYTLTLRYRHGHHHIALTRQVTIS